AVAPPAAARVAGRDHARSDWLGRWGWNSQVAFPADASRLRGLAAARASHGSSYRLSWKQYRARRAVRVGPPSVSQSRPDAASVVGVRPFEHAVSGAPGLTVLSPGHARG